MTDFDAQAKEAALRSESEQWDTSAPVDAGPGDIPVIDISAYRSTGSQDDLRAVATELAHACETVGFWQLVGHGIDPEQIALAFSAVAEFHSLPTDVKQQLRMDRPDWPLGGVGYLAVGNRKLPARSTGNQNEAFIVKSDRDISSDDNQWPEESTLPGFRTTVEEFGRMLEQLALDLLPIYATALGVESDWFDQGFEHPFTRLRLSRYPASVSTPPVENQAYGINPHVDTTFFTLLLQDSPGLTIYHTPKDQWINVPLVENAFVVNSGELLRQWSNDRYLSVRHFANAGSASTNADSASANADSASANAGSASVDRYSIPYFVNATRDYVMECIPTCCDDENPAKYPPISYNESQGVIQGE